MVVTKTEIQIAAKLYEMRDTARRFLGSRYPERMTLLREVIEKAQKALGSPSELVAAQKLCEAPGVDAFDVCFIMAAAVEMVEPSVKQQEPKP